MSVQSADEIRYTARPDARATGSIALVSTDNRIRRIARPWRITLTVYATALTIGTHWPRLELGTESVPVSDKLLHMAAFGGLTLLLWQAWIVRRLLPLFLFGVGWAVLDELTQAIPGLGRTVSPLDITASGVGVFIVVAVLWAAGPVGGARSRLASRRQFWSIEEALAPPRSVVLVGLGALAGSALGAVTGWLIFQMPRVERPADGLLGGAVVGAAVGGHAVVEILRNRFLRRAPRRCFECDADAASVDFELHGSGPCPGCRRSLHAAQWDRLPPLRHLTVSRVLLGAVVVMIVVVVATFGVSLAMLALRLRVPSIGNLDEAYRQLSFDMKLVMELPWIVALGAIAVRIVRRLLARAVDQGHQRCLACGHDLSETPLHGGRGICGECGALFGAAISE